MKKSACLFAVLIITTTLCRAQLLPDHVKLSLNLVKGATYYNNTVANVSMVQTVNGQKNNVTTTIGSRLAFKVINIRDTLYDMDVRYLSMALKMQLPTGTVDHSTEKSDPDLVSSILSNFKNQPIKVVMTKTGKLLSLSGTDAIWDHAIAGFGSLQAGQKAEIKSIIEQSFGDRALRSNFELGTAIYPTVPIRKSALWTIDTQMETSQPAVLHSVYELRDITDQNYLIHVNSTITYLNKDAFVETNGLQVKYDLAGTMLTDIIIDRITGWVTESKTTQTISGNTEIKNTPKTPGGMIIPMVMKSDIIITDK